MLNNLRSITGGAAGITRGATFARVFVNFLDLGTDIEND